MTHTVIGLFDNRTEAQAAIEELVAGGFTRENIDLSNKRQDSTAGSDFDTDSYNSSLNTDTSNDSIGDKVGNFFSSLFGDDSPETRNYSNAAGGADAILSVQTDSRERAQQASEILDRNGALDVDERAAQFQGNTLSTSAQSRDFTGTENRAATEQNRDFTGTENRAANEDDVKIPVMEEELQVGKREVDRGGVRVHSRIVEKPVEETVRLREEHVVVNRQPVNRAVTEGDFGAFKEGDIEITEHSEEAVVSKQARVTEEVSIGKTVEERDQVVSDTVRSTEVDVEQIGQDEKSRTARQQ